MPPRAARQKNAIPAVLPVVGGSRLERLPAELIQSIFDFLYIFDEPYQPDLMRPLSKDLLPYSTAALYRRIKITTFDDLGQLCASTSDQATLGPLVQELDFDGYGLKKTPTDVSFLALLLRFVEGLLCTSLVNLKTLSVGGWDLIGKVVLSERFGREGGKALESIRMYDSFGSIEGTLTETCSPLRHLPVLSTLEYHNEDPSIAAEPAIPTKLGGFEKVTNLECRLHDFASSHATHFAALFPSTAQQIELVHLHDSIRPNYSPFLDTLSPDSITSISLTQSDTSIFTSLEQFPVHQSLTRFPRLQHLQFYDSRIFDSELIEAIHGMNIRSVMISWNCQLACDLMHQLLSGIKKESTLKEVKILLNMYDGIAGRKYRDGAKITVNDAGNLIPGEGWERSDWSIITLAEARELERISVEKGIEFDGGIKEGLKVERAFEEEEKWLEGAMKYLRTGPVDCRKCGEAP